MYIYCAKIQKQRTEVFGNICSYLPASKLQKHHFLEQLDFPGEHIYIPLEKLSFPGAIYSCFCSLMYLEPYKPFPEAHHCTSILLT